MMSAMGFKRNRFERHEDPVDDPERDHDRQREDQPADQLGAQGAEDRAKAPASGLATRPGASGLNSRSVRRRWLVHEFGLPVRVMAANGRLERAPGFVPSARVQRLGRGFAVPES